MNGRTEKSHVQILKDHDGHPLYAVVPYEDYQALIESDDNVTLPHNVVELIAVKGLSPMAAWRKYRGLSQEQMAQKLSVSQGAIAQAESAGNNPQYATLKAWSNVLDCSVAQLTN